MSQPSQPTLINPPQPSSNPDTPSETPGTPTSTTTSLSALSTTAIKDGHRGHVLPTASHRGHGHHGSTTSLEAERADRISRLTGLSNVSTLRLPYGAHHALHVGPQQQSTPSSTNMAPVYFDTNGQPMAAHKISTVGTASATESVGGRTVGEGDVDEDMMSTDTNFRETEMDSTSGYLGGGGGELDPMDEDQANGSVGGFEDRMSDDGDVSLVGFGEGAGSTVSGPIYHRRPLPAGSSAGAMANVWGLERSSSGLSDASLMMGRRESIRSGDREGGDNPVSISAAIERRQARMVDGVAMDGPAAPDDEIFVDTTTRGPVLIGPIQPNISALRETQQQQPGAMRDHLERIGRVFDNGEERMGSAAPGSFGKGNEGLGHFYFEDHR